MVYFVCLPPVISEDTAASYEDLAARVDTVISLGTVGDLKLACQAHPSQRLDGSCIPVTQLVSYLSENERQQRHTMVVRYHEHAKEAEQLLMQELDKQRIQWKTWSSPPRFPIFIPIYGREALIVGGGAVAARRAGVLLDFGAKITVISPQLCMALHGLTDRLQWIPSAYRVFEGAPVLVVAATNERAVNKKVGQDAVRAGIPVSVADAPEESTFWFPAILQQDQLVAGMISTNGDHKAVKQAADRMRSAMKGDHETYGENRADWYAGKPPGDHSGAACR